MKLNLTQPKERYLGNTSAPRPAQRWPDAISVQSTIVFSKPLRCRPRPIRGRCHATTVAKPSPRRPAPFPRKRLTKSTAPPEHNGASCPNALTPRPRGAGNGAKVRVRRNSARRRSPRLPTTMTDDLRCLPAPVPTYALGVVRLSTRRLMSTKLVMTIVGGKDGGRLYKSPRGIFGSLSWEQDRPDGVLVARV